MLARSHWLAAGGSHGNPPSSHVRGHPVSTQAAASASNASNRTMVGRPTMRGIVHHAARYHVPIHAPTNGPSKNNPSQVTWCSHPRMIVHATPCAAKIVHAKSFSRGRV